MAFTRKIIPSKPPTQNTTSPVPDPFGGPPVTPFGRMTVEPVPRQLADGESGIERALSQHADQIHPPRRRTGMA